MSQYSTLLVEDHQAVRQITLNRPQMFNTLDQESGPEFVDALEAAAMDAAVRVLVITGAGKAFSGGGNVVKMAQAARDGGRASAWLRDVTAWLHRSIAAIRRMPQPAICALNGVVAGGGLGWALACDLVVAGRSVRLDPGYIRIAASPDAGSTAMITRILGLQRASEFFLLARVLQAEEALAWGLVNRVVDDGSVLDEALALAAELAQGPRQALAATKALLNRAVLGDLESIMEDERQSICSLAEGDDFAEGVIAFSEKRKPKFA